MSERADLTDESGFVFEPASANATFADESMVMCATDGLGTFPADIQAFASQADGCVSESEHGSCNSHPAVDRFTATFTNTIECHLFRTPNTRQSDCRIARYRIYIE